MDEFPWRKATYSGADSCVEVAPLPNGDVAFRDTKNPDAGIGRVPAERWAQFIKGVKAGEFDFND